MTRRRLAGGVAVLAIYVATAFLAHGWLPRARPPVLFDGFAPPAPYRWVNPPAELSKGNQKPDHAKGDAHLGPNGSEDLSVATGDGQAFVSFVAGAVPPHSGDTGVELALTAHDASKLGPLPNKTRFEGNAYLIDVRYRPSGTAVPSFTKPGTLALTASGPATDLAYSSDGKTWRLLPTRALGGQAGLSATLDAPGYVVTAGFGHPYKLGGGGGIGPFSYAGLAVLVLGTIALVVLIARRARPAS